MANARTLALIMIIVFVSFLGFVVENVFRSYSEGIMDNRNMVLPFLLGYGLAILAFFKLFGTPDSPLFWGKEIVLKTGFSSTLYYFAVAFLCVSVGEIILGYLTEWCCGIVWWNYTDLPLHVTKYTSVPTSFLFALMITAFMKYLFNPMLDMFAKIPIQTLSVMAITLIVLISIDFLHSGIYMFKNHQTLRLWQIDFERSIKEIIIDMKGSH